MIRLFRRPLAALLAVATLAAAPLAARAEEKALDPKLRLELIKAMRAFLALDTDPYPGREATRAALGKIEAAGGPKVLGDVGLLRQITDQARDFDLDYRDRKWQKSEENTEVAEGKLAVSVSRPDKLRLAFSAPKGHNDAALDKLPRPDPFPTLVTLIEEKDYTSKKFPGEEVIGRRYAGMKELFEKWLVLAPVAVRGNYIGEDGNVRQLFFTAQFKDFYQRFHVDFDRVVLDGDAGNVTAIAAAQPFNFAGLVVRRPLSGEPTFDADTVSNYAHVPVYVVGCPRTEKALKDAGHPAVTLGDDAGLLAWMSQRKRVAPKAFTWRIKTTQHVFANWLIVTPDWSAEKRTLEVSVIDTPEQPNTIRIEARGILDLTALLHDDIVDLGRDVKVVINGQEMLGEKFERTLERVFDRDPVRARESVFYGLLFTAITKQMFAPAPAVTVTAPSPPTAPADPAKEEKARTWLAKANELAEQGNTTKAIDIIEKLLKELGDTTVAAEATKRLGELKGAEAPK
jgi:hypothetical protein